MKGTRNPPRQQSTCRPIPRASASADSSSIGSMVPDAYCGAEPTSATVLPSTSERTCRISTCCCGKLHRACRTSSPKYCPAWNRGGRAGVGLAGSPGAAGAPGTGRAGMTGRRGSCLVADGVLHEPHKRPVLQTREG
eukprot:scaffold830_cov112-Isochrysis_galbana.AAC.9